MVVHAEDRLGLSFGFRQGWQQQAGQDRDDRDDHQKLDQCKRLSGNMGSSHLHESQSLERGIAHTHPDVPSRLMLVSLDIEEHALLRLAARSDRGLQHFVHPRIGSKSDPLSHTSAHHNNEITAGYRGNARTKKKRRNRGVKLSGICQEYNNNFKKPN